MTSPHDPDAGATCPECGHGDGPLGAAYPLACSYRYAGTGRRCGCRNHIVVARTLPAPAPSGTGEARTPTCRNCGRSDRPGGMTMWEGVWVCLDWNACHAAPAVSEQPERTCACGHSLAVHLNGGECYAETVPRSGVRCDCRQFVHVYNLDNPGERDAFTRAVSEQPCGVCHRIPTDDWRPAQSEDTACLGCGRAVSEQRTGETCWCGELISDHGGPLDHTPSRTMTREERAAFDASAWGDAEQRTGPSINSPQTDSSLIVDPAEQRTGVETLSFPVRIEMEGPHQPMPYAWEKEDAAPSEREQDLTRAVRYESDVAEQALAEFTTLRAALQTIRDDYDHDEDAHRHGTTCRVCLAVTALNEVGRFREPWDDRARAALRRASQGGTDR